MKTILITGANGGIGVALARAFLESDSAAMVFLGCRSNRTRAESILAENPERCRIVALEVSDPASWDTAVSGILEQTGRLDVLVNNAGQHRDYLLATMPLEDWHEVIATSLTGTFLGCRAVVKTMFSQRTGRIINIASLSALLPPAGQTNYAAAKAGVIALTQSFAKEVARAGITVNAICPGYIASDPPGTNEPELARGIPARRLGTPAEVAAAAVFLASDAAAYINGSVLKVDGGIL